MQLGTRTALTEFKAALASTALEVSEAVRERLVRACKTVEAATRGTAPVYGLNTGLGANLGHRISPEDIPAFQQQLIAGRAVSVGPLMAPEVGRAMVLARLIGVAQGVSGMSLPLFDHLCAVWRAKVIPGVPQHGSIGAADLTQNACWALAVLGQGQAWNGTGWVDSKDVLTQARLDAPPLQAKDAMALINHSGLSVAQAGLALIRAREALQMMQNTAVLSCQGFGANPEIFAPEINGLRPSPGQVDMAAWFYARLSPGGGSPRVQDALSFRTIAPVFGAAKAALSQTIAIWEDELNGASDNPAILSSDAVMSTANFHAPALALALEQVSLAMAMVAQSSVMRVQRMMDPKLSGLPRYLSPQGAASAGFVPVQKTAAALLAEVRRHAQPVVLDAAPVSDGVEDMAPMTAQAGRKLADQTEAFDLLCGIEAVVAAQARDLRGMPGTPLHDRLRSEIAPLTEDRPFGADIGNAVRLLRRHLATFE